MRFREQPKFRSWVRLEEQKNKILRAVEDSSDEFPNHLFDYLSTALHLSSKYYRKAKWEKVVEAFYVSVKLTACQFKLSIFEPSKDTPEDEAWDYADRPWNVYVHMLAKNYGWSMEYISNMRLEDALPQIQEILLADQLDKEFQWEMSERSSYYDDKTKTAKANPLPRPNWMQKHIDPKKDARQTKIPTFMMPTGQGVSVNEIIAQTPLL